MLNKNKTEDNFFTACKVSLSFSDLEERKKKKKSGTTRTKLKYLAVLFRKRDY